MSPPDVHVLTGAYALDALDDDERTLVERHLAVCGNCSQEVAGLRAAASALADPVVEEPPRPLRSAVLGQIASTQQVPAQVPAPAVPDPLANGRWSRWSHRSMRQDRPLRRRPVTAAAVSVVVVCVALGVTVADQYQQLDSARHRADSLSALASAALTRSASMPLVGGGTVAVVAVGDSALVSARDLPTLPDGRVYQFWLVGATRVRSAGIAGGDVVAVDRLLGDVGDTRFVAVTAEPPGGSTRPTTSPLVRAPLRT